MIDEKILNNVELAIFKLRSLYNAYGYSQYKMSKFEEYDYYVKNKDFLISDRIITFTDTNGKLLALKPDVTLSIIKQVSESNSVQKLYYNENVYRVSGESHKFKEIMQTGLECVGKIGIYEICEVTALAIKSLECIDENYQLDISHAGFVQALLKEQGFEKETEEKVSEYISAKNSGGINKLLEKGEINETQAKIANALIVNYKNCAQVLEAVGEVGQEAKNAFDEFCRVLDCIGDLGKSENVNINFSLANNMSYYSGIVFKGYIQGIPTGVLSGGQYDKLMKKLKKDASAVGFAVYLDGFERHKLSNPEFDADVVLIKDASVSSAEILKTVEELSKNGESVLVLDKADSKIKSRRTVDALGREIK
ncbi:MAG: ATP phosphoribosyltransferase regulatory subunit [Clostridia bacterium]|nr:ATP phosphoribosyltransferase regulatory subunit [Clostridia bacterium]